MAFWAEPELEARLKALHEAMQRDPHMRGLKLTKTDVLKKLIRDSLDYAELEYLRKLPEGVDPEDVRKALDQQHNRLRAILDTIVTWEVKELPQDDD
jgi:hypothetical protein